MKTALICSAVLAAPALALAGPLDPRNVPEDVKWVAHFDLEAARASAIGKLLEEKPGIFKWDEAMAEVAAELGMNPIESLHDLTAFGLGADEDSVVVLLRGTKDLDGVMDKLIELAEEEAGHDEEAGKEAASYKRVEINGKPVHQWRDGDGAKLAYIGPDPRGGGRRSEGRIVIFAQNKDSFRTALGVVTGDEPSLARSERSDLAIKPRKGSILYGAAIGLPFLPGSEVAGALARKADSVSLDVGEDDGSFYANLRLVAKNDTDAQTLSQIVQGGLAMARMLGASDPDMKDLVEIAGHVSFGSEGKSITGTFSYDSAKLMSIIKAAAEHDDDDADAEDDNNADKDDQRGGVKVDVKRRTRRAE